MPASQEEEPFLEKHNLTSANASTSEAQKNRRQTPGWKSYSFASRTMIAASFKHPLMVFLATSTVWLAIILLFLGYHRNPPQHRKASEHNHTIKTASHFMSCGRTVEESVRLGCKYDILSNHWVPAPCVDQPAVELYQADGSWYGYADENRTQLVDIETMGTMGLYYTNMRDHIIHCAVLWKKQFRAFYEERGVYDSLILDPKHTDHCADFLIDMTDKGPDFRQIPIKVEVGHAGCWIRD
ncbi:hypothetical protein CAC42_6559 [Sphaceloma murrayae]|uniref:Uncharacterized protein n=1 Tax=Sphaceloma murrayae TaxID=2082308 RepID=A0A2K1QFT6_9PEZI|nr:hypothetical protein CAC42_6559 [Sphaceloma murrayae]